MKKKQQDNRTPRELFGDLQGLAIEAEKMLADSLSEHSAETFRKLRARFDVARDQFTDAYAGTRIKVAAAAQSADEVIRAKPYQSLAIAAGIGFLVGALVSRRSS
jgi:ElaB/YqjD/DUF883 family membrane-anchored ribosome-binding protein